MVYKFLRNHRGIILKHTPHQNVWEMKNEEERKSAARGRSLVYAMLSMPLSILTMVGIAQHYQLYIGKTSFSMVLIVAVLIAAVVYRYTKAAAYRRIDRRRVSKVSLMKGPDLKAMEDPHFHHINLN